MRDERFTIHVSLTNSCQNKRRRRTRVLSSRPQLVGSMSVDELSQRVKTRVASTHVTQSVRGAAMSID